MLVIMIVLCACLLYASSSFLHISQNELILHSEYFLIAKKKGITKENRSENWSHVPQEHVRELNIGITQR